MLQIMALSSTVIHIPSVGDVFTIHKDRVRVRSTLNMSPSSSVMILSPSPSSSVIELPPTPSVSPSTSQSPASGSPLSTMDQETQTDVVTVVVSSSQTDGNGGLWEQLAICRTACNAQTARLRLLSDELAALRALLSSEVGSPSNT